MWDSMFTTTDSQQVFTEMISKMVMLTTWLIKIDLIRTEPSNSSGGVGD